VPVRGRHPEALDGFPLEIELDQHGRRAADHGRIVPGSIATICGAS
jgi:hypothetical protein